MTCTRVLVFVASLLSVAIPAVHAQSGDQTAGGREAAANSDIEVRTSLSQTALWVGTVATYSVSLTCRPGVDVLQEDLGADKLTLAGMQVVAHSMQRSVSADGHTHYQVAYALTTFEPGAETLSVNDWTVRYTAGPATPGASQPARDLRIPGVSLAWRSALPAELKTLDVRHERAVERAPNWWRLTRATGLVLIALSSAAFGWLLFLRMSAGRPSKPKRSRQRDSAREIQATLGSLREMNLSSAAHRLEAYATLEAAFRRHLGSVTALPESALTPVEWHDRLVATPMSASADSVVRVLDECQAARYQSTDRLPEEERLRASIDEVAAMVASRR